MEHPSWSIVITCFALFFLIVTSVFDRNYYLRFLNRSVFPTGLLIKKNEEEMEKDGSIEVYKMLFPEHKNKKIVYWASKRGGYKHPKEAYGDYTNGGVAVTDKMGYANLYLKETPGTYIVPYKGQLMPHIHYRIVEQNGMLGEVKTVLL